MGKLQSAYVGISLPRCCTTRSHFRKTDLFFFFFTSHTNTRSLTYLRSCQKCRQPLSERLTDPAVLHFSHERAHAYGD